MSAQTRESGRFRLPICDFRWEFPTIGKSPKKSSNDWKFAARAAGLLLAILAAAPLRAEELPTGDALVGAVLGAMPDIPLAVTAELQSRDRKGELERRFFVDMLLDWQDDPPHARYTLRDGFATPLAHLGLRWPPGEPAAYSFLAGNPLAAAPLPDLSAAIEGTDLSWLDLSLAFVRWPGPRTKGQEDVRGRTCFVVDVDAPDTAFAGCTGVRMWIEPKIGILMRAESYGPDQQPLRRMEIKSFRKINDRWFLKDLELTTHATRHTTVLRVRDVQDRTRKDYLLRDEGGPEETAVADPPASEDIAPIEPVP